MEVWKNINEFPGYSISNHGRVKSHDRIVLRNGHELQIKGCILKPGVLKKCGHRYVNLRRDAKPTSVYVHRIVALHFIGPEPKGKSHVAHWDGNPNNNHVENLRWASAAENSQDSIRLGRSGRPSGTNAAMSKMSDEDILNAYSMYHSGRSMREISRMLAVSHNAISRLLRQKSYKEDCRRLHLMPAV